MIGEMAALPNTDLHPDAVLARIKELQKAWKDLEAGEQLPGDRHFAAPPSLWRQFQAAGNAAFEHTKPFLDKRTEIQRRRADEFRALASRVDELAGADPVDVAGLRQAAGRAGGALRQLGELPAPERKKVAGVLRRSLDRANAVLRSCDEDVEKIKRRLIREAAQVGFIEDRAEAIAQAKRLQAEWKRAGSLKRGLEQRLWKAFREPLDPLFEQEKSDQDAKRQAQAEHVAEQQSLVEELQTLLTQDDAELAAFQGKVQGLQDAWRDIRRPAARHQQAFERAVGEYSRRLKQHAQRQEEALREQRWLRSELLHRLETALVNGDPVEQLLGEIASEWPEAEADDEVAEALQARRRRAQQGDAPNRNDDAEAAARMLCIRLEFLAGLPSPEEEKDQRMQYQVDRLSRSMAGERERLPALVEARREETEWLLMPWLPDALYREFRNRVRAAIQELSRE